MRITFIIFIFSVFVMISCYKQVTNKFDNYYEVINELAKLQVLDSNSILVLELIGMVEYPVEISIPKNDSNLTAMYLQPPPIPNTSKISKQFLRNLALNRFISSSDIDFIYHQIKIMKSVSLDPNKINSKTMSRELIETSLELNKYSNVFYSLSKDYGVDSYIKLSSPLITQDGETIIFDIVKYSIDNCKSGIRYVFQKQQYSWRIKFATSICVG